MSQPYYVFVEGQFFDNLRRTHEALKKLRERLRASNPGDTMVIVRIIGGGARMHAGRFAQDYGLPLVDIPIASYTVSHVAEAMYRDLLDMAFDWYPIKLGLILRKKGTDDASVNVAAEYLAERFIKTHTIEE